MAFAARERRTANSSRPSPVMWSTMVGATAVIVAAFFTLRPFESPRTNGTMIADAGEDPAVILDESVQIAKTLNSRFWNSVAPTATTFVRENPLQQEMGAVYADARSALQFLAANFLPESDRAGDASPAVESVPG